MEDGNGELGYEPEIKLPETDAADDEDGGRGALEYIKALGPPFAASVTALSIALIGYFGNQALKKHDKTNLYAELMSRREESESALRKDMFVSMTEKFFLERQDGGRVDYSRRLLQLEMLALNFGESMTMGPFHELSSEIRGAYEAREISFVDRQIWLRRLEKLARKVGSWQLAALSEPGDSPNQIFSFVARPSELEGGRFEWPRKVDKNEDRNKFEESHGFDTPPASRFDAENAFAKPPPADPFAVKKTAFGRSASAAKREPRKPAGTNRRSGGGLGLPRVAAPLRWYEMALGDVEREVRILLSNPDYDVKTVATIVKVKGLPEAFRFTLDFFDFPMIDSIRLSHDHRLSLILNELDEKKIKVTGVLFHGMYGSQRDKPFLDVVINQMQDVVDHELE